MSKTIEFTVPFDDTKSEHLINSYFKTNGYYPMSGGDLYFTKEGNFSAVLYSNSYSPKVKVTISRINESSCMIKVEHKSGGFWNPVLPLDTAYLKAELEHLKDSISVGEIQKFDASWFEEKSRKHRIRFWTYFAIIAAISIVVTHLIGDSSFFVIIDFFVAYLGAWYIIKLQTRNLDPKFNFPADKFG